MSMAQKKLKITPEFGTKLKEFRSIHKVKAKDLADFLNKSGAYISKLEKGEIQNVDKQEFVKIVNYITGTSDGYSAFFEYISSLMDSKYLDKSAMFLTYDWCERFLPIPNDLLKYLNDKVDKYNISINDLVEYINQNEELDDNFFGEQHLDKATIEVNTWIPYYEVDSISVDRHFIWVNLDGEELQKILNGETKKASYLKVYVTLYHIYKLERKRDKVILDDSDITNIRKKTEKKLLDFKFYTLISKRKLLEQVAEEDVSAKNVLSSYEYKNNDLIDSIIKSFSYLSDFDIDYMNKKLEGINNNLRAVDASFAVAYMALSLEKLADKSVAIKKEFLAGVNELIDKCANMVNDDFEKY